MRGHRLVLSLYAVIGTICWCGCQQGRSPFILNMSDSDNRTLRQVKEDHVKEENMLRQMEKVHSDAVMEARTRHLGHKASAIDALNAEEFLSSEERREVQKFAQGAEQRSRAEANFRRARAAEAISAQQQRVEESRQVLNGRRN